MIHGPKLITAKEAQRAFVKGNEYRAKEMNARIDISAGKDHSGRRLAAMHKWTEKADEMDMLVFDFLNQCRNLEIEGKLFAPRCK